MFIYHWTKHCFGSDRWSRCGLQSLTGFGWQRPNTKSESLFLSARLFGLDIDRWVFPMCAIKKVERSHRGNWKKIIISYMTSDVCDCSTFLIAHMELQTFLIEHKEKTLFQNLNLIIFEQRLLQSCENFMVQKIVALYLYYKY